LLPGWGSSLTEKNFRKVKAFNMQAAKTIKAEKIFGGISLIFLPLLFAASTFFGQTENTAQLLLLLFSMLLN
jgi:hypothetical protein